MRHYLKTNTLRNETMLKTSERFIGLKRTYKIEVELNTKKVFLNPIKK
jgi:hypothetical protein